MYPTNNNIEPLGSIIVGGKGEQNLNDFRFFSLQKKPPDGSIISVATVYILLLLLHALLAQRNKFILSSYRAAQATSHTTNQA
jgi:hypothetical protein